MTPPTYRRFKASSIAILTLCAVILTIALIIPLLNMWPVTNRLKIASHQLLDCTVINPNTHKPQGNAACLPSQLLAITGAIRSSSGAIAQSAPEITKSIASASANSVTASQATTELVHHTTALVDTASDTVAALKTTINDLDTNIKTITGSANTLLQSSDATIKEAGTVLANLATLANTLDSQVKIQSPEIGNTLIAMQGLINNPAIKEALDHIDATAANVEAGSGSTKEFLLTMDLATRDLRHKAGQVKWLLNKLLGMVKATVTLF